MSDFRIGLALVGFILVAVESVSTGQLKTLTKELHNCLGRATTSLTYGPSLPFTLPPWWAEDGLRSRDTGEPVSK